MLSFFKDVLLDLIKGLCNVIAFGIHWTLGILLFLLLWKNDILSTIRDDKERVIQLVTAINIKSCLKPLVGLLFSLIERPLFILYILLTFNWESLGVEITTIKGNWQSEKLNDGSYNTIRLSNNGDFDSYRMVTDTTYSKYVHGTWLNKGDTISLYSQGKDREDLIIIQLSTDKMTVKVGYDYFIMTRKYNVDPVYYEFFEHYNLDGFHESLKFYELVELKGEGIWYWIDKGVGWLCGLWFAMIIIAISAFIIIRIRICKKQHSDTYNHR